MNSLRMKHSEATASWLIVVIVSSIITGAYFFWVRPSPAALSTLAAPLALTTITSKGPTRPYIFENQYMNLTVPEGWKVTSLNGAIKITKDNYILHINPRAEQVSGAKGGRFDEIARGARGVDLIAKYEPRFPCGVRETVHISDKLERKDLFVSSDILKHKGQESLCNGPTNNSPVWYFSWVTEKGGGYLGSLGIIDSRFHEGNFFIYMTHDGRNINDLPEKGSEKLSVLLQEMTDIIRTLRFEPR